MSESPSLREFLLQRVEWGVVYHHKDNDHWHFWAVPDKSEALARQRMKDAEAANPDYVYRVVVRRSEVEFLDA